MASASSWHKLIGMWGRSGLTQSEFCCQQNLSK